MVVSLCAALGLHWAALQSIAWAGMLLNYSRAGSVTEAFEKTFDGRHPCPLCRALSKSQESGKKPEAHWPAGKLDLEYCEQASSLLPPTRDFQWLQVSMAACGFSPEPLVRPPRAA